MADSDPAKKSPLKCSLQSLYSLNSVKPPSLPCRYVLRWLKSGPMEIQIMETLVEQRRERRTDFSWPVSVWLPEADRFFNGRRANISKTGALVNVPLSTPAREGSIVELNFPRT